MMFKPIKLAERQLENDLALDILKKGSYGVLSTMGEDGYPYGVPLNYTLFEGSICFHSAMKGHKLANIAHNDKVSFCVVTRSTVLPNKFDTDYESIIAFGKAVEVNDPVQKEKIFMSLLNKYSAEFLSQGKKYMEKYKPETKVVEIKIDHITGKAYK